jgi:hypothetical protein
MAIVSLIITAFFTKSGVPQTGLSAVVNIKEIDGTPVLSGQPMTEVGDGFYQYTWASYNQDEDYVFRCDGGASLPNPERYTYGDTGDLDKTTRLGFDAQNNVNSNVETIDITAEQQIVNAVWAEDITTYTTPNQAGWYVDGIKDKTDQLVFVGGNVNAIVQDAGVLNDPSAAQIADTVWDELMAGHIIVGSAGEYQGFLPSINVKTSALPADPTSETNATANKDEIISEVDANELRLIAIQDQTDRLQFDVSNNVQANIQDKGVLNDPSASEIADSVWDELVALHSIAGSFGKAIQDIQTDLITIDGKVDNIPTDVDTQLSGSHGVGSWETANSTVVADAVWDELLAGHTIVGSAGEAQNLIPVIDGKVDTIPADVDTELTSTHGAGSWQEPTSTDIADAVWDELLTGATHNIPTSAGKRLRELSEAGVISSGTVLFATASTVKLETFEPSIVDIYKDYYVIITEGTGEGQIRLIKSYDLARVATLYKDWDITPTNPDSKYEVIPGDAINIHNIESLALGQIDTELSGTHGVGNWEGSIQDPQIIADAVWDELVAGHSIGGSFGSFVQVDNIRIASIWTDTPLIKAKTDNLPADPTSETNATSNKNEILTDIADIPTDVDTQLSSTHGVGSWEGSTPSDIADSVWDELLAGHTIVGSTGEAQNLIDDIDTNTIAIKAKTDNLPATPADETTSLAIKTQTDKLNFDGSDNVNANVQDKGVLNDLSIAQVSSAVWDAQTTSHTLIGSFGNEILRPVLNASVEIPSILNLFALETPFIDLPLTVRIYDQTSRITLSLGMVTDDGQLIVVRARGGRIAQVLVVDTPDIVVNNGALEISYDIPLATLDVQPGDSLTYVLSGVQLTIEGNVFQIPDLTGVSAIIGEAVSAQGAIDAGSTDTNIILKGVMPNIDDIFNGMQVLIEYQNPLPNTQSYWVVRNVVDFDQLTATITLDEPLPFTPPEDNRFVVLANKESAWTGPEKRRTLGLVHQNIVVEHQYTGQRHDGSTIYLYDSKANAEAHDKVTGLLDTFTLVNEYNGDDLVDKHTMVLD